MSDPESARGPRPIDAVRADVDQLLAEVDGLRLEIGMLVVTVFAFAVIVGVLSYRVKAAT